MKLPELKKRALSIGISADEARSYGPLTRKDTWEKVLSAHAAAVEPEPVAVVVEPEPEKKKSYPKTVAQLVMLFMGGNQEQFLTWAEDYSKTEWRTRMLTNKQGHWLKNLCLKELCGQGDVHPRNGCFTETVFLDGEEFFVEFNWCQVNNRNNPHHYRLSAIPAKTLAEVNRLKSLARDLGLSDYAISLYGSLYLKDTWQTAIDKYRLSLNKVEPEPEPEPEPVALIDGPLDLPEPSTIKLEELEIKEVSPNLARAGGIYEQPYKGYDIYASVLHGCVVGGAIVAPNICGWQFTTGYLGELKRCYLSDWVVRRWFSKVARRVVDEFVVNDLKKEGFKPFKLHFSFENDGDRSQVVFNVTTYPSELSVFDFWNENIARRAIEQVKSKTHPRFFGSQSRLFVCCEGVIDREVRSRILGAVSHQIGQLKNKVFDLELVAIALDQDYSVIASNCGYELGDIVSPSFASCHESRL